MYYQFTGQPGHGKTVLAIEFALEMKAKADRLHDEDPSQHPRRELYVCNVRDFNHGAAFALPLTPDEVKRWCDHPDYVRAIAEFQASPEFYMLRTDKERDAALDAFHARPEIAQLANERINPVFENAIILIDEAYEHGMFPRRPPGRPVPRHVERVAKHRHFGIDFIMICQSPGKQMDDFLHDLIEEHYHVRRRYGLPFVHIKRWDRFEPKPDKAEALTTKRRKYPRHIFKLYTSTRYDTSERRVPWFYWAAGAVFLLTIAIGVVAFNRVHDRINGDVVMPASDPVAPRADGAGATAAKGGYPGSAATGRGTPDEYVSAFMPRVPGQPWSAPAYDSVLSLPSSPPRVFCMVAGPGIDSRGESRGLSCGCITEQGTRYEVEFDTCAVIARYGQYEPYLQSGQASPSGSGAQLSLPGDHAPPAGGGIGAIISGDPSSVTGSGIRGEL